jgi:transposase InsO family protein
MPIVMDPSNKTAVAKKPKPKRNLFQTKQAEKVAETRQEVSENPKQRTEEVTETRASAKRKRGRPPRKELTPKEVELLEDLYYRKGGYRGRDQLFDLLQRKYEVDKTPKKQRISRRRMYNFFLARTETQQLHRQAPKKSLTIKSIISLNRYDKVMADLIIRGGDSARKYKGVLCVIDVATRKAYTRVITSTTSKYISGQFQDIIKESLDELNDRDKKKRNGKAWIQVATDNGAEFLGEFPAMLKRIGAKHIRGVANRSTSQSMIERFNRSLQSSMEKERTSTGARWYDLVAKHTAFYNDKPNRKLKLPEKHKVNKNKDSRFKTYTPNELWETDRETLTALFEKQQAEMGKSGKRYDRELLVKVGQKVRLVLEDQRKGALAKGFTQNYSKSIYTVSKVKRPKSDVFPYFFNM